MEPTDRERLTLELEFDADSFSGTAKREGEPPECFTGWIGLAAAGEAWRTAALAAAGEVPG